MLMVRLILFLFCTHLLVVADAQEGSENIKLNQLGFFPESQKLAVANTDLTTFKLVTHEGLGTVYEGALSSATNWSQSEESVRVADFSDFKFKGTYRLKLGSEYSHPFTINDQNLSELSQASLKAYYFNRASTALPEEFAGDYQRQLGHPDDEVIVLPSAASATRPAGTSISTPYGWYDAGDYNKYIVNSGISMFTLLAAYENYPEYYEGLNTNIPESDNDMPDLLDEVLWNLKWMLTMQDPEDGGVYNKTTHANFQGVVMPHRATATRYVVAKGTAATLDFAAVMAMASRIYAPYLPDLAAECLEKSRLAWQWAQAHPNVPFNNPGAQDGYPGVVTGGYGDSNFEDEFFWAAAELYITTKEDQYYQNLNLSRWFGVPGWPNVETPGILSLITHRKSLTEMADTTAIKNILLNMAGDLKNYQKNNSPYRIPNNSFYWGSNSLPGNQGMLLTYAYQLTGDIDYFNAALGSMDYLLGRNATGYSFVTGFGGKPPMDIHHRQSAADDVSDPVPGFLAGGPNPHNTNDCGSEGYPSLIPAKCYVDDWCSYSTNEITINWNAPMVFLAGALQHIYETDFKGPDRGEPEVTLGVRSAIDFEVYPNPASHQIHVKSNGAPVQNIRLMTIAGQEVLTGHGASLDVSSLKSGVYLLNIQTLGQTIWRRISVESH